MITGYRQTIFQIVMVGAAMSMPCIAQAEGGPEAQLPAPSPAAYTAPAPSAEQMQLAMELAKITSDGAAGSPEMLASVNMLVEKQLATDPSMQELEKGHPGIIKHISKIITDVSQRQTEASMPKLQSQLQTLFADNMNGRELQQALAFYRSAVGQRLIAAQHSGKNLDGMFASILDKGEITESDIKTRNSDIAGTVTQSLDDKEENTLLEFAKTQAFLKVRKLGPKVTALTTAWSNEVSPEDDAAMDAIIEQEMSDYMAKSSGSKAGKGKK